MESSGHAFEAIRKPLVFALNGKRVEIPHVDPTMTVLTYLRTHTDLKGTKLGCGEGGCGACVVVVSTYNVESKKVDESTVNSCLALLCSMDGRAVTTIEGIGNTADGLHSVQKRFTGFHASQCGFCTPGMCMALYGALRKHSDSEGFKVADLERSVGGNICRCTGYRPISDVCKSFADDTDVEDLGLNTYWSLKDKPDKCLLPRYDASSDPKFPEFLIRELEEANAQNTVLLKTQMPHQEWVRTSTLKDLFAAHKYYQGKAKMVIGNTSTGVYKFPNPEILIDISAIPELVVEHLSEQGIEIGAAVRIARLVDILESYGPEYDIYLKMAEHMKKVATIHVRHAGSVGGNVLMAQNLRFDSDIATLFLGAGVSVKLVAHNHKETAQTFDEFLESTLHAGNVLKSICIPSYKQQNIRFGSYRASPRPLLGNAVAYVNAAFLVHLSDDGQVQDSRLAFGAFGADHAYRATNVEKFLNGKAVTEEVILEAMRLVRTSIVPEKGTEKAEYRSALVVSFLFKFLSTLMIKVDSPVDRSSSLVVGSQMLRGHPRNAVGLPLAKYLVELQTTGEAVYVDDIPTPPNCLHAAYVYSTKALAKIKGIDLKDALASPGAFSFVGVKDIPPNGKNLGINSSYAVEALFASDTVECYGQALGLMVADTQNNAKTAADKLRVDYDTDGLGAPVLKVEQAVEFYEIAEKSTLVTEQGNASEELANADFKISHAEVRTGSQYYFYMEPQTALALPDENNCIVVYSSSQSPDYAQTSIASCLGIPAHNVRVITRRVGGGFGGKFTKGCLVATACALAAYKLRRPVRLTVDRNTDMIMMSGRHPMKAVYSVGFDLEGKIKALDMEVSLEGGWSADMGPYIPRQVLVSLKKFNWGSFKMDFKIGRTNSPSKTAVRGPGDTQGSFIADAVIEHVATFLGISSHEVMEKNLHTLESAETVYGADSVEGEVGYTLPLVWKKVKENANFDTLLESVERYNSSSLWRKRGVAMAQCSFQVTVNPMPARVSIFADASVAVEVGGVEIGQGLWTKVRQTTAGILSKVLDEGYDVDVEKVRIVQADTISMPHGGWTGGSSTSEASCEAVRIACKNLVERLKPVKENMQKQGTKVTWDALITSAKSANVNPAEQVFSTPGEEAMKYLNYGAAVSEVEIDALTGEHEILQMNMVYDCGKSVNPATDIGQIEGAFVQGVGFFTSEEYGLDENGKIANDGTWTYKPPTLDNVPRKINIELLNSEVHKERILSSKASGEPPLLLASSVHGAIRHAISAARKGLKNEHGYFQLDTPATVDKIRMLCGADNIEVHLQGFR